MDDGIKILRNKDIITAKWSGGETRELLLVPSSATVKNKNFFWRLSSATIHLEESTFTPFPNHERILMIISGNVILTHEDHYEISLVPWQMDHFSGNWQTSSKGKDVIDYNLIYRKDLVEAFMEVIIVDKLPHKLSIGTKKHINAFHNLYETLYLAKGNFVDIEMERKTYHLATSELFLFTASKLRTAKEIIIKNNGNNTVYLIRTAIMETGY